MRRYSCAIQLGHLVCQSWAGGTFRVVDWWASSVTLLLCLSEFPRPDEAEEATHEREAGAHVHNH